MGDTSEVTGYRIYIITGNEFDLYVFTVFNCADGMIACRIARTIITPGDLELRWTTTTASWDEIDPPPSPAPD